MPDQNQKNVLKEEMKAKKNKKKIRINLKEKKT